MLTFSISKDKRYLELIHHDTKGELKDLQLHFRKRQKGYLFNRLYKRKLWDGYDHFVIIDEATKIPKLGIGLWKELLHFGQKYDYDIHIEDFDSLFNKDFTKE